MAAIHTEMSVGSPEIRSNDLDPRPEILLIVYESPELAESANVAADLNLVDPRQPTAALPWATVVGDRGDDRVIVGPLRGFLEDSNLDYGDGVERLAIWAQDREIQDLSLIVVIAPFAE